MAGPLQLRDGPVKLVDIMIALEWWIPGLTWFLDWLDELAEP